MWLFDRIRPVTPGDDRLVKRQHHCPRHREADPDVAGLRS
jgi:hypothetical protein